MGKSCLYLKRLAAIDQDVLRELVGNAFAHLDGRTLDRVDQPALTALS